MFGSYLQIKTQSGSRVVRKKLNEKKKKKEKKRQGNHDFGSIMDDCKMPCFEYATWDPSKPIKTKYALKVGNKRQKRLPETGNTSLENEWSNRLQAWKYK